MPRAAWETIERARQLTDYASHVQPIAHLDHLALLDAKSDNSERFAEEVKRYRQQAKDVDEARAANQGWKRRFPPNDASTALKQAQHFEGSTFAWIMPSWWRLRDALHRCYDFRSHVVRPSWSQVLRSLEKEYRLEADLDRLRQDISTTYQIDGKVDRLIRLVFDLRESMARQPEWLVQVHEALLRSEKSKQIIDTLVESGRLLDSLTFELGRLFDDFERQSLERIQTTLSEVSESLGDLPGYLQCLSEIREVPEELSVALRNLPLRPAHVEAAVADRSLEQVYREDRPLDRFGGATRQRHARRLEQSYESWLDINAREIRNRVKRRFLEHLHVARLSSSQLTADQKIFKNRYNHGRRELEHEFGKTMRYKSIRDLVANESGEVIKDLKPVWLMSPLSVSDTLPLDTDHVDVVIFDEASQITLEESVPSIFRATQAIVVGDEMQLPPTDFFSAKRSEEEEELLVEDSGELIQYDLNSNSFLNHAAKTLPSTMLGWHYRSRSESLISFSNWTFYNGRLLTVPEEQLAPPDRTPLTAVRDTDGEAHADELLKRSISFHFMEHGVYSNRRNRAEADYIAQLVRRLLKRHPGVSIGIAAFSQAQQDEIETALNRLAQEDKEFRNLLDGEFEREEDGQFVGLLVKNLENIQGDERDVIILSVCYGHSPNGKMLMNFGPINKSGGEKRLNVAFSRAKYYMALVTSIRSSEITNDYNDGANCLKNYLRYAEAVSNGNLRTAQVVLRGMSRRRDAERDEPTTPVSPVVDQIASALSEMGYQIDRGVGQSHFRCELAVRCEGDAKYRLGILVDNEDYYLQSDVLERDMMRPKLLRNFGWNIAYVLAKDWYADRDSVVERLRRLIHSHDAEERADVDGAESNVDREHDMPRNE